MSMLPVLAAFSYCLALAILAALAYRDIKEYILPDHLNAALALSFMSFHISTSWHVITPAEALLGSIMGGGLLLLIRAIANKFYDEDSLGLGDVKLMAAAGLGLGHPDVLMALTVGAFVGVLHGLCMGYAGRKVTKGKLSLGRINVPAGVGLASGIAVMMICGFGFEWLQ